MNKLVLLLALALCTLFSQQTLNAQTRPLPYDPPKGWRFLRHLDGTSSNVSFTSAGDTILVGIGGYHSFSTDAGRTWDTLIWPSLYHHGVIPGSVRLYAIGVIDGRWKFGISTDLGKSFTYYDTKIARIPFAGLYVNPHDPDDYIIRLYEEDPHWHTGYERYGRSTDGGKTWNQLILPRPKDGDGEVYKLGFDAVQPGVWYLGVSASLWGSMSTLYKSTDNGSSFHELWSIGGGLPPEAFSWPGFDGPGMFRQWWRRKGGSIRGSYILDERMRAIDSLEFFDPAFNNHLKALESQFPQDKVIAANMSVERLSTTLYHYRADLEIRDSADSFLRVFRYLVRSTNAGLSWEAQDSVLGRPAIKDWWANDKNGVVLAHDSTNRYSLWALGEQTSSVRKQSTSSSPRLAVVSGENGALKILLSDWTAPTLNIRIADSYGRVLFESDVRPDKRDFEIGASAYLVSGVYMIIASGQGTLVSAPFSVVR